MKSIFERIISGELPAERVFEDENILAIKDIHPVAPVHILIMPKKHTPSLQQLQKEDVWLMGEMIKVVQELAKKFNIEDSYRLLTNNGPLAGQSVFHLHFHLIGGRNLGALG